MLSGPASCGVRGHAAMGHPPIVVAKHDEAVEPPEANRRDDEVTERGDLATWFASNVRHVGEGSLRGPFMCFATVDSTTVKPSRCSSDRIRSAPQVAFSRDMRRTKARTSASTAGRPGALHFSTDHRQPPRRCTFQPPLTGLYPRQPQSVKCLHRCDRRDASHRPAVGEPCSGLGLPLITAIRRSSTEDGGPLRRVPLPVRER